MVRWFQVVDSSAQNPRQSRELAGVSEQRIYSAFTLVEMLVAMAITLVMMAAVVTLFANVSNGVRKSRATMEMSGQIRQVRNVLQQDLQGATCPGQTWQRPESNHGYIEIIEGPYREGYASNLIDGIDKPTTPTFFNPEIDHTTSILPASNLPFTSISGQENWATDGGGLGDYDDILMLTVRNEQKPFVGRAPNGVRQDAKTASIFDVDDSTTPN
ncbi:MAG TPA: prepilin-type N-terminal cleavage/methylation domain-containing protein, partial [Lacipirellulaceae bacterium]|nr:prepilin-type N-terminal cleavage/methylation domain-containing protein [Lacipirellulaceae bacterium]